MSSRLLYVGTLGLRDTSTHRRQAIARLGHAVDDMDAAPYFSSGGPLLSALRLRTLFGAAVTRFNQDVLERITAYKPDVVWFDKPLYLWPETLRQIRKLGVYSVHFTIDNPFGPRGDPGWRHVIKSIPEFDLNLVQRDSNLADFQHAGSRATMLMRTAYDPLVHFPPPTPWSDQGRKHDVVYIGAPYDRRAEFILELWRAHQIPVKIWGSPNWSRVLPADAKAALWQGCELWNADYREKIWQSRMCLAFVTHSNCDDVAHKSFEITASGGVLLAEDTPGHRAHFAAHREAVFFSSVADCAAQIARYLPDEASRGEIARAGSARAQASGYSNDARIADVFRRIELDLGQRKPSHE